MTKIATGRSTFFTLVICLLQACVIVGITNNVNAQAPTISSFVPASGPVGTLVTVNGTNLNNPSSFKIGGVSVITVSSSATKLLAVVMPGATSGPVAVTTASGTAAGANNFTVTYTPYPSEQQGNTFVAVDTFEINYFRISVSISADGNTAIIGNSSAGLGSREGGAWIFTRSGGNWTQQGLRLFGTGAVNIRQGTSVSLSADGNTALVGGAGINPDIEGAAWVFTRSGTTWAQQGNALVPNDNVGIARFGGCVSLSADGNTAIIGGLQDNANVGAAWIFTRNSGNWSQLGAKLVGTGSIGAAQQGRSVALSADGKTAMVGGPADNATEGAAWIYIRTDITWVQQGTKLVGSGRTGLNGASQGYSVALSADGNTAIMGGWKDNNFVTGQAAPGAAWVFTRQGESWTQYGEKLVGEGNAGDSRQGWSVALSADGNTAVVGGMADNNYKGAAWVFTRTGGIYQQRGSKLVGSTELLEPGQGSSVALSADGATSIIGGSFFSGPEGGAWVFVAPPPPVISSFSPTSGPVGTLVTIQGNNLASPTEMSVAGAPAIPVNSSKTSIVCMVGPGATTGYISLTALGGGSVISSSNFTVTPTPLPTVQQGTKLIGSGNIGAAQQGGAVAISADGNTAIVGGSTDNDNVGAAWIFTRTGNTWRQQGDKLVGSGSVGAARQGLSVAISADGNTAIVGGPEDSSGHGAAWIYTRTDSTWSQYGLKLTGTDSAGPARQGFAVAISADGKTAIVGGRADNSNQGAAWVFRLIEGIWVQQGSKLVGSDSQIFSQQGWSVAISADGNTVLVGGPRTNSDQGGAWVFVRNGRTWQQQGPKIAEGDQGSWSGRSVALSADGNTAIIGAFLDLGGYGSSRIYKRITGIWGPVGSKISDTSSLSIVNQGSSVSMNADGKSALVGSFGSVRLYALTGDTAWIQQGAEVVGDGVTGGFFQGRVARLSADGKTAIVGINQDNANQGAVWIFVPGSRSTDYFRSIASGSWSNPSSWESSSVENFSNGIVRPATIAPNGDAVVVTIRQTHNINLTSNVSVGKLFLNPGAVLTVIGCILSVIKK